MINSKCELGIKLRDDQWEKLEPLLLGKTGLPGCRARDNRLFIEAVLWYVSDTNIWADLPPKFGKWNTIYMRVKRWYESGHWQQLAEDLSADYDLYLLVKKIIAYCDGQKKNIKQKLDRKVRRQIYKSSLVPSIGTAESHTSAEDSASHWIPLVEISTK